MAFDFKKADKEYYMSGKTPELVNIPSVRYVAVRGKGDPNDPAGDYQKAIAVLYGIAYTIKMSKKGDHRMEGYFDFVVPPLEGFWWQEGEYAHLDGDKSSYCWISAIRLPDFVTQEEFEWAVLEARKKKNLDCSSAEYLTIEEGLCVQILHNGPFDTESQSIARMDAFMETNGLRNDFSDKRLHHEIYLSDARKTPPEKWKTVIRHPVCKVE